MADPPPESITGQPMCPHCDAFIAVRVGEERCPQCLRRIAVRSILVASKVYR